MKKYFVIINGEKFETTTRTASDALLIDAMLSGVQFIDWTIYEIENKKDKPNKGTYFTVREVREWRFIEEFNSFCWTVATREELKPYRTNITDAKKDFEKLGIIGAKLADNGGYCYDDIKPRKIWVRYIIQYKAI